MLVTGVLVGWPMFMFSYLHGRMHPEKFWMTRTPMLKTWFQNARRLHDIHHRTLNDQGRMDRKYGIAFFFFDRVFRTMAKRRCPLNWHGYRAAIRRHRMSFGGEEELMDFPSSYLVWERNQKLAAGRRESQNGGVKQAPRTQEKTGSKH